ncbi:MAG: glycerol-3-phosphate dehydrogenase/oxidase, partial [Solirubrobacteraceae bacterium]
RSSKLIHGGLRYLQHFDLGLVREALLERQLNVHLAPHLVHPLPFVVPAFDGARPDRMLGLGLNMYDVMAVDRLRRSPLGRRRIRDRNQDGQEDWSPERHRVIDGAEVAELLPALAGREPSGGYLFYDCQTDDVRLVLTVLGEAERYVARSRDDVGGWLRKHGVRFFPVVNWAERGVYGEGNSVPRFHLTWGCGQGLVDAVWGSIEGHARRSSLDVRFRTRVTGLLEEGGRARGAEVRDTATGEAFAIEAAAVVNATGVWADRIRPDELHDEAEVPVIRPSRGSHIILPRARLPLSAGVIAPAAGGKTVFVLPWLGQTLVGTTDNDYDGDINHVRPSEEDVAHLLEAVNGFFATELGLSDIVGAYAGVRPLISSGDPKKSVDISRKAELYETSSGMVTITGGKLTTWRRMAKMTVDRLVEREGRDAPCRTHEIPLGMGVEALDLPRVEGVHEDAYEQLAGRYGYSAHAVLAGAAEHGELAQPILPGMPDLLAEAAFAARREQARSVTDVLLRRTRLGLTAARALCAPGGEGPERVAKALGRELGWDDERCASEADAFRSDAVAEGLVVGT